MPRWTRLSVLLDPANEGPLLNRQWPLNSTKQLHDATEVVDLHDNEQ